MDDIFSQIKKRILYRAKYRGTRENDFLITNFVEYILSDARIIHEYHNNIDFFHELDIFLIRDDYEIFQNNNNSIIENLFINFYKNKLYN